MTNTARNMFNRDLEVMLALSDARKAENAQRRAACRANAELIAVLSVEASRRGQSEIDWAEYFRNVGLS